MFISKNSKFIKEWLNKYGNKNDCNTVNNKFFIVTPKKQQKFTVKTAKNIKFFYLLTTTLSKFNKICSEKNQKKQNLKKFECFLSTDDTLNKQTPISIQQHF